MSDSSTPDNDRKPPIALSVLGAIAMLALIALMLYIGGLLHTIEDQLAFQPPRTTPAAPAASVGADTYKGHAVYVPAYSHIYSRGGQPYLLEITLSVRNTDPRLPIDIQRVRYFDTAGRQIREFDETPIKLGPLQTAAYLVEKTDTEGGSGASFIVEWIAEEAVNPPVIEAVMIGSGESNNISFTSRGRPITRR